MPGEAILGSLILKLIGSVCGTALALIFAPPRNWRDFQRRSAFSLLSGVVLTPIAVAVIGRFIEIRTDEESLVAAASMTAFASWWVGGAVIRVLRLWNPNA